MRKKKKSPSRKARSTKRAINWQIYKISFLVSAFVMTTKGFFGKFGEDVYGATVPALVTVITLLLSPLYTQFASKNPGLDYGIHDSSPYAGGYDPYEGSFDPTRRGSGFEFGGYKSYAGYTDYKILDPGYTDYKYLGS